MPVVAGAPGCVSLNPRYIPPPAPRLQPVHDPAQHLAEGLYQALRFPNEPWLRHAILGEKNPIQAKALSRANIALTRPDWERVRVQAMRWVLRQKLQHPPFQRVLLETGDRPIVELSYKDQFWGAKPEGHKTPSGMPRLFRAGRK